MDAENFVSQLGLSVSSSRLDAPFPLVNLPSSLPRGKDDEDLVFAMSEMDM